MLRELIRIASFGNRRCFMKVVMITGNGGSGGLVGYIRGILSASVISNEHEVVLFCGTRLFERLGNIRTQVKGV